MSFHFRLEPVLRLRRRDEDTAKKLLGAAIALEQAQTEALQVLQDDLALEIGAQSQARSGEIWAQGQQLYLEWSRGQNVRIAQQRLACTEAALATQKARAALVEARRAVQVLEKLRERRYAQWRLERSRQEQIFTSEVAAQRWMRQRDSPEFSGRESPEFSGRENPDAAGS